MNHTAAPVLPANAPSARNSRHELSVTAPSICRAIQGRKRAVKRKRTNKHHSHKQTRHAWPCDKRRRELGGQWRSSGQKRMTAVRTSPSSRTSSPRNISCVMLQMYCFSSTCEQRQRSKFSIK